MKKIGLFLGTEPFGGGKHQYAQAMLDAVASLPSTKYSSVVAFSPLAWKGALEGYPIKKIHVPDGFGRWFFDRFWRNARLPISVWMKLGRYFYTLSRKLHRERCDLWIFPAEDTVSYQVDVPALCTIFDLMHRYESQFPEVAAYGRAVRRDRHYRNICQYAKGVLVDSEVGRQQMIDSYGVTRGRVHSLPYIAPPYIASNRKSLEVETRYELPKKFIFYPAQFWEHKNHKRLISALAMLKPDFPDLKLVLVGSKKNAYESVVRLVESLGLGEDVLFLGYVPDEEMPGIYKKARALVMPTFFGPTNIPPLEAFAMGCPVAISNIYGMPEQVGDAAVLFDPTSEEEIADAIKKLWCDDEYRELLVRRGLEKAESWGQPQYNERLEDIISDLLD